MRIKATAAASEVTARGEPPKAVDARRLIGIKGAGSSLAEDESPARFSNTSDMPIGIAPIPRGALHAIHPPHRSLTGAAVPTAQSALGRSVARHLDAPLG